MPRRSSFSRRPALEQLEIRCNPSSIHPLAGAFAEPAADTRVHVAPGNRIWEYTPCCDPTYFDGRFLRADDLISEPARIDQQLGTTAFKVIVDPTPSVAEERQVDTGTDSNPSNTNTYFTNDYSLSVSEAASANLNAFAGQTVRLRIAAVINRNQLIVGVDDATIQSRASTSDQDSATGGGLDVLIGNTGGDRIETGVNRDNIVDLIVDPRNRDTVYLGGAGDDVLVGGAGQDQRSSPTGKLYVATNVGVFVEAAASSDPVDQSGGVLRHELGHALGFQHEHTRPASDAPAAAGNMNNDRFADIVTGAAANGHVKVFDGTSGAEIRSFFAFDGFPGEARVGVGEVVGDGFSDIITGSASTFSHVKVFAGTDLGELESVIDSLARDVASQKAPSGYQTGSVGWVKISPDA